MPTDRRSEQAAATCHCGRVAEPRGSDDPWEGRMDGYCYDCAVNRCDCYPDECPVKHPPTSSAATKLDEKRPPCRCEPWAQRWRADHPEVCVTCGGLFAARTVPARRLIRGR